jgi:iron complex transport system substrate-binding protein
MFRSLILAAGFAAAAWSQPARIVSTSPSITETLFALDLGPKVVGVTTYCRYPPAVLSLPKIGTYSKPDPEKIALLHPDLVIIHRDARALAERLAAIRIPSATITVGSLDQVFTMISDIANATGVRTRGEALNTRIRKRLDQLRAEGNGQPKPSVIVLVGRNPGLLTDLIAVGPGTYLGELIAIAGGRNVLSDAPLPYPKISFETVVRLNPDVVIDGTQMGDAASDPPRWEERLREPWLSHRELNAVQSGRVFGITSETLVTPGPRVVDAVKLIHERLYAKGRQ